MSRNRCWPETPPAPPPPGAVTPAMQADLLHRVVMLEAEHLVDVNQIKGARYDIAALQARLAKGVSLPTLSKVLQ